MPEFNVRSDSINVEQVMEQIRARIREKRGADYTEEQIRQLATVKLEKFLDPRGVRSDLLDEYRRAQAAYQPPEVPNYAFEEQTLFESTRAPVRWIRRLLLPILKLFFNPNPLIQALHIQSRLNTMYAQREQAAHNSDQLHYEVLHNLVVEMTRTGIEVKNLKMQVESLASRLEFNERRARSLESVVVYKPAAEERMEPPARREPRIEEAPVRETGAPRDATAAPVIAPAAAPAESPGQRSRRRRRRRGRRGGPPAAGIMGAGADANVENASTEDDGPDVGGDAGGEDDFAKAGEEVDHRLIRPEPFPQALGTEAHPSETVAADPAANPAPPPGTTPGGSDEPQ
jgi:hypothetical protein